MNTPAVVLMLLTTLAAPLARGQEGSQPPPAAPPTEQGTPEPSGADSAGMDRVRAAATALREARTLSFRLKTKATGMLVSGTPIVDFSIRMVRTAEGGGWSVRVEGEGRRRETESPQEVTALFDDTVVTWIDHAAKSVGSKPIRSARGPSFQLIYAARVTEIMSAEPLTKELASVEAVLEGQEEFDGVTCDIVGLRAKAGLSATRWWFGQADHLPRKIEKSIKTSAAAGSSSIELLEMQTGAPIAQADLQIRTPDGYTRVDEASHTGGAAPIRVPPVHTQPPPQEPVATEPPPASGEESGSAGEPTEETRVPTPVAPPSRAEAPDSSPVELKLTDEKGQVIDLATLRGHPVVLFLMATWSLPSRSAITEAEHLRTMLDEHTPLLAVAVQERFPEKAGEFVRGKQASLRVVPKGDELASKLNVRVLPAVIVLDTQGVVHTKLEGIKSDQWDQITKAIEALGGHVAAPAATPSSPQ